MPKILPLTDPSEDASGLLTAIQSIVCLNPRCVAARHRAAAASWPFCSVKAPKGARFKTAMQRDALRVFEVSSLVRKIHTNPPCLKLEGRMGTIHCAPALVLEFAAGGAVVEINSRRSLKSDGRRACVVETQRRLRALGVTHVVFTREDVREPDLQEELAQLIARRPASGRFRDGDDVSAWDPLFRSETEFGSELRWLTAQRECDALLARVMRRDPGELILALR